MEGTTEHLPGPWLLMLGLQRWRHLGGAWGIGPFLLPLVPGPCFVQVMSEAVGSRDSAVGCPKQPVM